MDNITILNIGEKYIQLENENKTLARLLDETHKKHIQSHNENVKLTNEMNEMEKKLQKRWDIYVNTCEKHDDIWHKYYELKDKYDKLRK